MPVTITRTQRDAIYEMLINHLSGIGDVWLGVQRRDFADAKRLGRKFAKDLRLLEDPAHVAGHALDRCVCLHAEQIVVATAARFGIRVEGSSSTRLEPL